MKPSRIASWLAALAMALNALWPLIAQAKPRSVTLVPVCTVQGEETSNARPRAPPAVS